MCRKINTLRSVSKKKTPIDQSRSRRNNVDGRRRSRNGFTLSLTYRRRPRRSCVCIPDRILLGRHQAAARICRREVGKCSLVALLFDGKVKSMPNPTRRWRRGKLAINAAVMLVALWHGGCASMDRASIRWPQFDYRLRSDKGPQEVRRCIETLIESGSIPGGFEDQDGRTIVTGWSERRGQTRGILFWQRTWQERSRLSITSVPGVVLMEDGTIIGIDVVTQERPNANYEWESTSSDHTATAEFVRFCISKIRSACV